MKIQQSLLDLGNVFTGIIGSAVASFLGLIYSSDDIPGIQGTWRGRQHGRRQGGSGWHVHELPRRQLPHVDAACQRSPAGHRWQLPRARDGGGGTCSWQPG